MNTSIALQKCKMQVFTQIEIEQIFSSSVCRCGERKAADRFFCVECFKDLPNDFKTKLSRFSFGKGLEEMFERCFEYLTQQGTPNIYKFGENT